ncbi:uncharacterized protein LOC141784366 [Halichoeres trimaculatus]|uniref:uncharacterized protein LOC141784366 n=1 Tax=Halichoeres trimaculatus TaxID=147232 RepID=UPI003D9F41DF
MGDVKYESNDQTVLILLFCLIALLFLLFFLYKKLNREANGEYTIQRMVYKEGGLRDRVRGVVSALEARLGVQLWPRSDTDEDGEEMQEVCDEERQMEEGRRGSDGDGDDQEEGEEEEEEERRNRGDETSDDNSSLESSEAGERARLTDEPVAKGGEKEEKVGEEEGSSEASGGAGLLIDLKKFSGSATWSEDGVCKDNDVTAL